MEVFLKETKFIVYFRWGYRGGSWYDLLVTTTSVEALVFGSISCLFISELGCQHIVLKINLIFIVTKADTYIGYVWIILVNLVPSLPIIIYLEDKTWYLNLLSLFHQKLLPLNHDHSPLLVCGIKKSISFCCTFTNPI